MFDPPKLPFDVVEWRARPFVERFRVACLAWADGGMVAPPVVYAAYGAKILLWAAAWAWFCTFTEGNTLSGIGSWWASDVAFQKLLIWTFVYEGLGLGCGSGPLSGHFLVPMGGVLYWLRPGTTKQPLFPGLPVLGGHRRTVLDAALYAALVGFGLYVLVQAAVAPWHLATLTGLLALVTLSDRVLFLAFRSEHYLSSMVVLLFAGEWVAGQKWVWLAIWWWAAASKATHHFPYVMGVMNSNSPVARLLGRRHWMFRDFPRDVRPSTAGVAFAHAGMAAEFLFPALLLVGDGGLLTFGLVLITLFHLFIVSNLPVAVPLEWNFVMIYGAWVLFGAHADVSMLAVSPMLVAWLVTFHLAVPLYANLRPDRVSFLLGMRYYAGNWPFGIWLIRKEVYERLYDHLVLGAPLPKEQLVRLFGAPHTEGMVGLAMAARGLHLHGRMLPLLLPRVVDDLDAYEWQEGEAVAAGIVGWNFGDGHIHNERLLAAVQAQVGFAPGDLRCLFVEGQPLFGHSLAYRIVDAADGELERGEVPVAHLRDLQPWDFPAAMTR